MKTRPNCLFILPIVAAFAFTPRAGAAAGADSAIHFNGVPAELAVSQVSDRAVRLALSPLDEQGRPRTNAPSPALVPFPATEKLRVRELARERQVRVGQLRLTVRPHPLTVTVRRADGTLVQELVFDETETTNSIAFRTAAPVLGLGEGAEQFDRRGYNYRLINGQSYRLAELGTRIFSPFLIGTEGWALFISAPFGGVDLRGERGLFSPQRAATPGVADIFVIDAREPADALREYVRLTGAPVMPPKWALGYMQSHRTLSTEADLLAEARLFRERQLPCDTLIYLGTGFCTNGWNRAHDSFQFNPNVFTREPAEVIKDLHALNMHVVLHVVPLQRGPQYPYPSLHGQIPPAPGETLDVQHVANYWARHKELFAAVDGWWPDEGDWYDVPSRLARHRMYYEGPLSDRPDVRPWDLQRNGYAGIGRYGGWYWSGDVSSSWNTLAAHVKVGVNSVLSVSPYWGTDIGGFYPAQSREYTGELYVRWFQYGAFCPMFRSHGRTWWLHTPYGWNTGQTGPIGRPPPPPSELTNAVVEPICRQYLNLRYQLMPYTYTLTREAYDTGLPQMRALWLHYPNDPEAVKLGDEYLWGRDLLVAPVVEKDAKTRRLYLPSGDWYDWWTGDKLTGHRWNDRAVDLATMPIYVRAGAILPLDPVRQYIAQPVAEPTTLRVHPGANGDFTLYDDDGNSQAYLKGPEPKAVWIRCRWDDKARRLTLEPDARMKKWSGDARRFLVEVVGGGKAVPVVFSGQRVTVKL